MKAITYDGYGSPDVLQYKDVDKPVPKDKEVLIRVHAAGLDAGVVYMMRGEPLLIRAYSGVRTPRVKVLGRDVAGTVEAVGKGVTEFKPGDEVFGEINMGSFAEYTCGPEKLLAPKPSNVTFEQAAAVPVSANTALQGLRDVGKVQAGQRVLITGASGGVGTFAVQIAKSFGAAVTGVCSTSKMDLVRSLGADHVIDYTREDFTRSGQRYDVMFDLVGNRSLADCRRVLAPKGILVLSAGQGGSRFFGPIWQGLGMMASSLFISQRVRTLVSLGNKRNLLTLKELIESGAVTPAVDKAYPLSQAADAIRYMEAGNVRGKVVIKVHPPA